MAHYRALVTMTWTDSLPRDAVSHSLHFESQGILTDPEKQDLVDDIVNAFLALPLYTGRGYDCRLYNMADPKPRPIASRKIVAPTSAVTSTGNRDVCIVLSFFADRNLPRYRGRIYLGPLQSAVAGGQRPTVTHRDQAGAICSALGGAGPATTKWCVYSTVDQLLRPITNWYVDDEFDTQRRRGLKPTTRSAGTVAA